MLEIMMTSSILILALALLRYIWRDRVSHCLQYALWLMVAVRLLTPLTLFENPLSLMNRLVSVTGEAEEWAEGTRLFAEVSGAESHRLQENERLGESGFYGNSSPETAEEFFDGAGLPKDLSGQPYQTVVTAGESGKDSFYGGQAGSEEPAGSFTLKEMEGLLDGGEVLEGISVRKFLRGVWYAGMAVMTLWIAGCNVLFRRRIAGNRVLLGQEGGLKVYLAQGIVSPCLLGVLRPAIYLTPDCIRTQKHKEHAIIHERVHYCHKDHFWTLVRTLCLVIYWFDPFVWLAVYLAARDCEMACDEGVLRRLGEKERQAYGRTLIEMAAYTKGSMGLLRCAAGLSFGKRELKNRIVQIAAGKKRTELLAAALVAVCGAVLAACTFGGVKEEDTMGRYVEEAVELPGAKGKEYLGMSQDGAKLRLFAAEGTDTVSEDGITFESLEAEDMPAGEIRQDNSTGIYNFAGAMGGARAYLGYQYNASTQTSTPGSHFLTETGEMFALDELGENYTQFFYSKGSFYVCESGSEAVRYYELDPASGDMRLLLESGHPADQMVSDGKLLYLLSSDGALLCDLKNGAALEEQDPVLSGFVKEKWETNESGLSMLVYPYREGVYLLTHQGIFWHELYGESVERVIDGRLCSIGDREKAFTAMALLETEGEPEFLVLYNGNELMRYTYDAGIPSVPEALRIYSVYEDSQITRAVNSFRRLYPDIPVIYEAGMNASYGITLDDALKNLATEIAAGNGPDILVMDDIPYESYVEKGVLMDLSYLRNEMTKEQYFLKVIDGFVREDGLYTIPMTFATPVLGGKTESLEGLESLEDLGNLLESKRAESDEDYIFCTWDGESTLRLLAQSSQGAWMKEGKLDREAVTEFLTQAKRIYEIQFFTEQEPEIRDMNVAVHDLLDPGLWIGKAAQYPLARRFDSDGVFVMQHNARKGFAGGENAYYAGFMSAGEEDNIMACGVQEAHGDSYVRMPGQSYGTCLASSLLSIREGTAYEEECKAFLEYALSSEFLADGKCNGTPVNREAYEAKKQASIIKSASGQSFVGYGGIDGKRERYVYDIGWLKRGDYEKLDELLEGITGVNTCDTVVYETVVEYGQKALSGESSVEEAVEAIEKRLKIYLAE